MENGVVNGGKEGKSQGIEGSANAYDVRVWMRPQIGFCTIGNCDLVSFFLLIESLLAACKFYHLFLKIWSFSIEVSPLFCFNPCSSLSLSLFLRILLLLGRDFTHWNFLGESLGKKLGQGMIRV
jgi:hypothetical protein